MTRKSVALLFSGVIVLVGGTIYLAPRSTKSEHPNLPGVAFEPGPEYPPGRDRPACRAFYVKGKYADIEHLLRPLEHGAGTAGSFNSTSGYSWSSDESGEGWSLYPGRNIFDKWDDSRTIKTESGTKGEWTTIYYTKPKISLMAQFFKRLF